MLKETNISSGYIQQYRQQLGEKLREKRHEAKLCHKELANEIGVSANTVKRLETGTYGLSIDLYIKAAIILNFKISLT